jgi:hypothetical protein
MRGTTVYSTYEYQEERRNRFKASDSAKKYRDAYLALRKLLREYSKENNIRFPEEINKAIGLK